MRRFPGLTALPLLGLIVLAQAAGQRSASDSDLSIAVRAPGNLQSRLRFEHLTSADGLSDDTVFSILQDHRGFMWFGTQGGLNRYDGYRMTQYRHDPEDPHSLGADFIQTLFEDSRGGIWSGLSALSRFDPDTGAFTGYPSSAAAPRGVLASIISGMAEDQRGFIWVARQQTPLLYRFDPATAAFRGYDIGKDILADNQGIWAVYSDARGMLWLGTDRGLVRFDPVTATSVHYSADSATPGTYGGRIVGVAPDPSGKLLLVTGEGALLLFDPITRTFSARTIGLPDLRDIQTVWADPGGPLWLGITGGGVVILDPQDGTRKVLRSNPADGYSLSGNEVWSIVRDREGDVWAGVKGGGVNRLSGSGTLFGAWRHDPGDTDSLSDDNVRAIYGDSAGSVWIGTYNAGVDRFEPESGKFTHYRHDPRNSESLDSNQVYSIYGDRKGTIWVGTALAIDRMDPKSGAFERFSSALPPFDFQTTVHMTYYFLEDRAGRFWFGSGSKRSLLDRSTGAVTVVGNGGAVSMHEDRNSNLWWDSGNGLARMDPGGRLRQFDWSSSKARGFGLLSFFHEDSAGLFWLATDNGLVRFDPKTGQYTAFTTRDGLPDNVVQCILPDRSGNLWVSTDNGLSVFNPREKSFYNYHERDGLQGEQFNRKACFEDTHGRMYFGGLHGFNVFDPRQILASKPPSPEVALTEIQIHGKTVPVRPGSVLLKPIWEMNAIKLPYQDNGFSFEFAALSFRDPDRIRYRFRMDGLENEWTEVDSRHRYARYTDLWPGKYTFYVSASDGGANWSGKATALGIVIAPPWWMTPWSEAGAILMLAGLIFGAHRWRVRAMVEREEQLEALVAQRTVELQAANQAKSAFLANMSHELRTPLNAILGFTTMVRDAPDLAAPHRKDLDTVNRSGEHLLSLIDDVLDLSKIEAGRTVLTNAPFDVSGLVTGVAEMMQARARTKNLELIVNTSSRVPAFANSDAAKLRQVLINLVGNAVKFTSQGGVTLNVDARAIDADRILLILEVQDTGVGIALEDQARIFEAFVQAGQTSAQKGTGLGLSITRQFVQMMGGTIEIESTPGKGSLFRVELPVEQSSKSETVEVRQNEKYVVGLAPGQPEYRILIVEDKRENSMLLQRLLQDAGFRVQVAEDGAQGVETFRTWRPNLIWMDMSLPVMRGMEAAGRIRALEGGAQVKIVALSASVFAHQRGEALAAGMDDFLRKPYRREEIFDCMARQLGVHYIYREVAPTSQADPVAALLAEDLSVLPRNLRDELEYALVRLDAGPIYEVIGRVSAQDPQLGALLNGCAKRFAYTEVLNAIEECNSRP